MARVGAIQEFDGWRVACQSKTYSGVQVPFARLRQVQEQFRGLILSHFHQQGHQGSLWTSLTQPPSQAPSGPVGRLAATAYSLRYLAASLSARIQYLLGGRNGPHADALSAGSLPEADAALLLAPRQPSHRERQYRESLPNHCCAYAHTFFEVRGHSIMLHIRNRCYSGTSKTIWR